MVCKVCPARRHCWDKGNCQDCEFGKAYNSLSDKIKRLKGKNAALEAENTRLKESLEAVLHPDF